MPPVRTRVRDARHGILLLGSVLLAGSGAASVYATLGNLLARRRGVFALRLVEYADAALLVSVGLFLMLAGGIAAASPQLARGIGLVTATALVLYTVLAELVLIPLPVPGYPYLAGGLVGAVALVCWTLAVHERERDSDHAAG